MELTSMLAKWNPLKYLGIIASCLIAAASINLFVVPSSLLTGGVTGIAIIFYFLTGLPIGIQTLIYNVPLLIASYKLLGEKYTVDVIIGTVMFSLALDAIKFFNGMLQLDGARRDVHTRRGRIYWRPQKNYELQLGMRNA